MPNTPRIKVKAKTCFVCSSEFSASNLNINTKVNMFVCADCKDSKAEELKVEELLNDLGSGFTVGCIS